MGTWHKISAKHLQAYLQEMTFRFDRRAAGCFFEDTLGYMVRTSPLRFAELISERKDANMPRDSRKALVDDKELGKWLRANGTEKGEYYKFYLMARGERGPRVVVRVSETDQVEIRFDANWVSLLDSMDLGTPEDSPEIRARDANNDPWSD